LGIGDWGLGIGVWELGIENKAQSPIPNPQSPNPQSPNMKKYNKLLLFCYKNEYK